MSKVQSKAVKCSFRGICCLQTYYVVEKGEHIRMYKLKDGRAMHNNDTGVKNIIFDGIIIGNISFEINENSMHINDINIDVKYTHKKHATNLLIQLVKEYNIDIIDGTGTFNEGEYFWNVMPFCLRKVTYGI